MMPSVCQRPTPNSQGRALIASLPIGLDDRDLTRERVSDVPGFTLAIDDAGTLKAARSLVRDHDSAVPQTLSGTERILLVEDEAPVRAVAVEILTKSGYTVEAASTIADAINTWTKATPPFDLVLADVVMPDASGWALGEYILAHAPEQKIIFMSGYSHEVLAQGRDAASTFKLLQKPFTRLELLRTIRRTLDRRI